MTSSVTCCPSFTTTSSSSQIWSRHNSSATQCPPNLAPRGLRLTPMRLAPPPSAFSPYCSVSSPYPSPPLSHGRPGSSCGNLGVAPSTSVSGPSRWSPVELPPVEDDIDDSSWCSASDMSLTTGSCAPGSQLLLPESLPVDGFDNMVAFGQRGNGGRVLTAFTGQYMFTMGE